ncbi:bifunctional DRAP deaminase/tRNA pseudouridine synthase [Saccharomycopsis crataegensis]|uniref:Bifunctional DRAP deaminase/tRNA pseudouridine synthase n=1 Tax=Saccharomycopsis crataegensis TaxID=43959 RepID=A0AAV5QS45_9ASCO|nr:bifunctional DRAP deaminase/tRNA pseudouridine synthase [Saccharomycopsis crataegensis]
MSKKQKTSASAHPNSKPRVKESRIKLDAHGFKVKSRTQDEEQVKPEYVIDGALRRVKPYYFVYKTYCKQRWRERTILDIFSTEFRDKSLEYYRQAIEAGQVKINDVVASVDTIIHDGDYIHHRSHKHEPPVLAASPEIIFENDNILVISKPNGLPAHPTGRYKFNSAASILKYERGLVCHPCNRLDRLTSGLMFLAKTSKGSRLMYDQLTNRTVEKYYIARVVGDFPLGDKDKNYEITVDQPLESVEPRLGLNGIAKDEIDGKHATTIMKKISYDKATNTSIVKCQPLTGRSHQIRVHLQYLGHPIANDPLYSNVDAWGPELGKGGLSDYSSAVAALNKCGRNEPSSSWYYQTNDKFKDMKPGELLSDKECEVCKTELYTDPNAEDLEIWLHAYKYQTKNYDEEVKEVATETQNTDEKSDENEFKRWSFQTPLPHWALDSYKPLMELAIKEAAKCPPTTTAFSVGAVLVNSSTNEILATGYSRELPGNTHAEQNALTKYYASHNNKPLPDGTVLYTTMEPCSLRLSGNLPCVDRILETEGKIVSCFVGVMEPKTFVENNVGREKLMRNGVEYVHIPGYEEEILKWAYKGHENKE